MASQKQTVKITRMFIAALASNLSSFAVGTCLGWTSPILPKLKSDDLTGVPLHHEIDLDEEGWISSIISLGALASPFVAGPLTNRIGRKWVLLSSALFFILAYALMMIGGEVWVLLLGRFIQGLGTGFVMTAQPMYLGEISTDNIRGALSSMFAVFMVCGGLYVYCIGPFVSYQVLQWCCIVVPLVSMVSFFFMPETPYYYMTKGRTSDAIKSLQLLRGQSAAQVQEELTTIRATVAESMATEGTIFDIVKTSGNRKALIMSVGLIAFQQLSGANAVLFNSQAIFDSTNTGLDGAITTIILAVIQLGLTFITPLVIDRVGRKIMLLTSAAGMTIGLGALGTFFYIQLVVGDISNVTWLPISALLFYNITYGFGFGTLPWVVLSETFATNVKSIATSLVVATNWIIGFVVPRWYPALDALGAYYAFWLFAGFCVLAFFFVLVFVIETKGLSLQEIQDRLNGKKPSKKIDEVGEPLD